MEHFGYVIAITSMIVVLFIVTNIYWDYKSSKVYKRFERLLETAEISQRAFVEGKLREIEREMDLMRREIKSAGAGGGPLKSSEGLPRVRIDSSKRKEDRETMVVFGKKPKDDSSS
jgi:CO dehydrogenase nickel-insertion accessory protein CooC1